MISNEQYYTVFDITKTGFQAWWFSALGLIGVAFGLAFHYLAKRGVLRKSNPFQNAIPLVVACGAAVWTLGTFALTFTDYRKGLTAMRSGTAKIVEGVVTQFIPMPPEGHAKESFFVQGVRFEYSDYVVIAGFHQTASHGGPIQEGLMVKIWYLDGEILRLDIKGHVGGGIAGGLGPASR